MTQPNQPADKPKLHTATIAKHQPMWVRVTARVLLTCMLWGHLPLVVAQTQGQTRIPIVDPTAALQFRPQVNTLGNGAAVVNITTPNAAGMSLNRYQWCHPEQQPD